MNQFDQEIRDKISSKSYDYTLQAWKAFKKHSGMPMMSMGAKVGLFGSIATVVVGCILYFTLNSNSNPKPQTSEPIVYNEKQTEKQQNNTHTISDSTEQNDAIEYVVETTHSTPDKTQPKAQAKPQTEATTEAEATDQTKTQPKPVPRPIKYGRPLEILVDTISSNDFPDYKPKPADMLP